MQAPSTATPAAPIIGQQTWNNVPGTPADGSSPTSLKSKFEENLLGGLHDGSLERVVADAETLGQELAQAETCVTTPETDAVAETAPSPMAVPAVSGSSS